MRSDYALYIVAIIFFVLTGIVAIAAVEMTSLWVVTTVVLGFLFVCLGYSQRPRMHPIAVTAPTITSIQPISTTAVSTEPPQPLATSVSDPAVVPIQEIKEEKTETPPQIIAPAIDLTNVKGIGPKRASQLKALGIDSIDALSNASAKILATQLNVSPKFTQKWIQNAKELAGKS